jgi:hypothetical protein
LDQQDLQAIRATQATPDLQGQLLILLGLLEIPVILVLLDLQGQLLILLGLLAPLVILETPDLRVILALLGIQDLLVILALLGIQDLRVILALQVQLLISLVQQDQQAIQDLRVILDPLEILVLRVT